MVVTGVVSLLNFEPLKLLYCVDDVLVFPVYLFTLIVNFHLHFLVFEPNGNKKKKKWSKHSSQGDWLIHWIVMLEIMIKDVINDINDYAMIVNSASCIWKNMDRLKSQNQTKQTTTKKAERSATKTRAAGRYTTKNDNNIKTEKFGNLVRICFTYPALLLRPLLP